MYIGNTSHSDERLTLTDRERRTRHTMGGPGDDNKKGDQSKVQFLSESGRPLLFSFDDTAYDDAAYLVDRTFEKPY